MGIEIESPEDFLSDYKDPKWFNSILEYIREKKYCKTIPTFSCKEKEDKLEQTIFHAQEWLFQETQGQPFWNANIEANASLSAQFILMALGIGYKDHSRLNRLWQYIISKCNSQGIYPLYYGGAPHYSTNLLIYLAGRALGYPPHSSDLQKLHDYLQANDITKNVNMETRLLLATFGLISWDCVPMISPLLVLIPKEAEFNIYSISYWVRTSLVPMSVLYSTRYRLPHFPLSSDIIREFQPQYQDFPTYISKNRMWDIFLRGIKKTYNLSEISLNKLAINLCKKWILDHQDRSGDWGGIYPAMQYCNIALYALGEKLEGDSALAKGISALERFQKPIGNMLHQQSCVSPVWDTAWSLIALNRSGLNLNEENYQKYFDWLINNQIFQEGDWSIRNKSGFGGGWAFQFDNAFYPDTDDTAVVIMTLLKHSEPSKQLQSSIELGVRWLLTMQNPDGGWSSFEKGVDDEYVNMIPFNDMDNWSDPSTSDITGRCLQMFGEIGLPKDSKPVKDAISFLLKHQEKDGSWFGRWGVNYIYGTWSALMGLQYYFDHDHSVIQKAVNWLCKIQNPDGGWGESCDSYLANHYLPLESTASQTGWALLSLIAVGQANSPNVERGISWLIKNQNSSGTWEEKYFTGTGFPKHFYLRYDYYRHYFPLWALGEYSRSRIK